MVLAEKIHRIISYAIRIALLIAIASAIINNRWTVLFVSCLTFFLTFLPAMIERNYKVELPVEFELIIVVFIYAAIFLGEVHGYYTRFWWWDVVLHTGSGIALGFAGFIILYVLYTEKKIKGSPFTLALFSFSFAVAIGAVWEIFEFTMDSFFGMNMQKSGLVDTMWDLIVNSLGAFFTSILGYIYIKGGNTHLFERFIRSFISKNPHLFKKEYKSLKIQKMK